MDRRGFDGNAEWKRKFGPAWQSADLLVVHDRATQRKHCGSLGSHVLSDHVYCGPAGSLHGQSSRQQRYDDQYPRYRRGHCTLTVEKAVKSLLPLALALQEE